MKLSLAFLTAALTASTALAAAVNNDHPLIKKDMAAAAPSGTTSAVALASPSAAATEQYGTAQLADESDGDDQGGDDQGGDDEGADGGDKGPDAGADQDSSSPLDFLSGILGLLGSLGLRQGTTAGQQ